MKYCSSKEIEQLIRQLVNKAGAFIAAASMAA